MDHGGVSAGEVGGVFAGIVAGLAAIGKGIAWMLNWKDARENSRAARLHAWEQSLDRREKEHREETEARLGAVESKLSAVSMALFEAIGELQRLDPFSPILASARLVLQQAYPVDPDMPAEIKALIRRVDRATPAKQGDPRDA